MSPEAPLFVCRRSILAVPVVPEAALAQGGAPPGIHSTTAVLVMVNKKRGFGAADEAAASTLARRMGGALEDHFFGVLESEIMQEWLDARARSSASHL